MEFFKYVFMSNDATLAKNTYKIRCHFIIKEEWLRFNFSSYLEAILHLIHIFTEYRFFYFYSEKTINISVSYGTFQITRIRVC